jgi:NAD(P)-dependent dehydrogenase (short-subunit alcohol dehydrogenase family)
VKEAKLRSAVIIGASGGIGAALADQVEAAGRHAAVHRFSRSVPHHPIDFSKPETLDHVTSTLAQGPAPNLVIVATGLLHNASHQPEKALSHLDADWMAENFRVNAIGPALLAQRIIPLMPRGERAVFAALSARVGSISDNRTGGWHSYRASKAALNQYIRTAAIEWARKSDQAICVALHPGTVDTAMSAPFQRNVAPEKLFSAAQSAAALLQVIDGLTPAQTGKIFAWDGQEIAP